MHPLLSVLLNPFIHFPFMGKTIELLHNKYRVKKIIKTQAIIRQKLENIFKDARVKYGPFKGLQYPELQGVGSELFPKLLGCYEIELADLTNRIKQTAYDKIVNIGCAEGYYAIGLGLFNEKAEIYAYDTDEQARMLCRKMGEKNGVISRLHIGGTCTMDTLQGLDFSQHSLIICDCEGFELELFQKNIVQYLVNCDILIELHDFINPEISKKLLPLFNDTHALEIFRSMDDELKFIHFHDKYKELASLTDYEKKIALGELRPTTMEWAFFSSKKFEKAKNNPVSVL